MYNNSMSQTVLTVVRVEWGEGYYKNGELVDYQQDKWERMEPKRIIELYKDCEVVEVNMHDAAWEYSGDGFPDKLEDALNKDFDPHAGVVE
jgi:hypothetical protein